MKKTNLILIMIFLCFLIQNVIAQDMSKSYKVIPLRTNPDGYIGGITFIIEPGINYANGSFEQDTEGDLQPTIPRFISQDIKLRSEFIKSSLLFPVSTSVTLSLNSFFSWFKEKGEANNYFYFNETSYTRYSLSLGLKIYIGGVFSQ